MKVRYEHENKDPHATRARRVSAALVGATRRSRNPRTLPPLAAGPGRASLPDNPDGGRTGRRRPAPVAAGLDPGSYLIRDFSRQIESLAAYSGARRVAVDKLDNHTWQAAPCDGRCASNTRSAWDLSVRGAPGRNPRFLQRHQRVPARARPGTAALPGRPGAARASRAGRCTPACRKRAACLARPAATASGCTGRPTTTR